MMNGMNFWEEKLVFNDTQNQPLHQLAVKQKQTWTWPSVVLKISSLDFEFSRQKYFENSEKKIDLPGKM